MLGAIEGETGEVATMREKGRGTAKTEAGELGATDQRRSSATVSSGRRKSKEKEREGGFSTDKVKEEKGLTVVFCSD
jgi:hypothetical protein